MESGSPRGGVEMENYWQVKTGVRSGATLASPTRPRGTVTFHGGLVGEEDAAAEQVGAGASVHLSFEHLDAVDVAFDGAGAPGKAEPVGDGVLVGAQAGDEGAERGLAHRVSAEAREVAADLPATARVSVVADLLPQLRGVGAAGVPPLAQVGRVLVEDAGSPAGSVVDELFLGAGGAGEPADGVTGQAQLGGDLAEAAAGGQQPVHVGVPAPRPVRDPPGARDGGQRHRF